MLLDEPTTDLDTQSQAELIDFIKQNRSAQLIIAMTHDKGLIDTTQHVIKAEKEDYLYYENGCSQHRKPCLF